MRSFLGAKRGNIAMTPLFGRWQGLPEIGHGKTIEGQKRQTKNDDQGYG
jgi:hypothetical protein